MLLQVLPFQHFSLTLHQSLAPGPLPLRSHHLISEHLSAPQLHGVYQIAKSYFSATCSQTVFICSMSNVFSVKFFTVCLFFGFTKSCDVALLLILKMCFIHPASCKRPHLWNGQACSFLLNLSRWFWIPICLHYLPLARGSCGLSHKSKRSPVLSQEVKETLRSTRMHPCSGPESFYSSHHVHSLVCKHRAQGLSANMGCRACLQTWGPGLVCKHGVQGLSAILGCRVSLMCVPGW